MLEINITLLIQFINFIFLIVVLNFILFRPLRGVLQKRRAELSESHARVAVLGKDVQTKLSLYEAKLDGARKKGAEIKNGLRQEGLVEEQRMVEEAEMAAQQKKESIREQIIAETGAAKKQLKAQVDSLAREITEKVLGRAV
ncbi:MAG: ATP synthase F0 subunit B [Desulfuromonadaceae bacterium]|nr:ATP synthase F0 subunit B [Desulfuromonadaceae bacterium]